MRGSAAVSATAFCRELSSIWGVAASRGPAEWTVLVGVFSRSLLGWGAGTAARMECIGAAASAAAGASGAASAVRGAPGSRSQAGYGKPKDWHAPPVVGAGAGGTAIARPAFRG